MHRLSAFLRPAAALPAALFTAVLIAGCGEGSAPPRPALARNLILISIDTLRADRLGAYGYDRRTSRNIDALASGGVRFENVFADSGWTLPSHVSLFTGLPPTVHGVTHHANRMGAALTTLPEILQRAGFRTIAMTGGGFLSESHGFSRGFDEFEALRRKDLGLAVARATLRLQKLAPEERFFLFLHTYEVHCPYTPPSIYAHMFVSPETKDRIKTGGRCDGEYNAMQLTPGQAKFLSDMYDAGIRYADDLLKKLFDEIIRSGRLKDTIVVLLSDHGEEFFEHGRIGHTDTLYIENLRVPWIMAGPGLGPAVVSQPVGLADVLPTVLEALGIAPPSGLRPSLLPVVLGEAAPDAARPVFSENDWPAALRSGVIAGQHVLLREKPEEWKRYDLGGDPKERENLAGKNSGRDAALRNDLESHFAALAETSHDPQKIESLSEEEKAELRALGYVE